MILKKLRAEKIGHRNKLQHSVDLALELSNELKVVKEQALKLLSLSPLYLKLIYQN